MARDFDELDFDLALNSIQSGKATGFDGLFPEFLKNIGVNTKRWLVKFYNNILSTSKLPKLFRKAKILAILKPGKDPDLPDSYRPISLFSVGYKLLERLLHNRISPLIDQVIPCEQAGFRPNRKCFDQVAALTSYIETGFQRNLKTAVAFIYLSAVYDTVWIRGLLYKFLCVVPCVTLFKLFESMLSYRHIQVFINGKSSQCKL